MYSIYFSSDDFLQFRLFLLLDIADNEALVLNVILSPHEAGTVTFYVPVVIMNAWEAEDGVE